MLDVILELDPTPEPQGSLGSPKGRPGVTQGEPQRSSSGGPKPQEDPSAGRNLGPTRNLRPNNHKLDRTFLKWVFINQQITQEV